MAKVVLNNAHVARVFDVRGQTTGLGLEERYTDRNGNERSTRYSVFFEEPHGLNVGDIVNLEGLLSASIDTYIKQDGTPGYSVSLKINKPKYEVTSQGSAPNLQKMAQEIFTDNGAPF